MPRGTVIPVLGYEDVEDLGGHVWTFSQTIADVAPEAWGGTTGSAKVTPPR